MNVVSFGIVLFFSCLTFLFYRDTFLHCAPSGGEIWNLFAAFSMYVFLLWVDDSQLELTLFSLLFPVDC